MEITDMLCRRASLLMSRFAQLGTSNFMILFLAEYDILMHPFHIIGLACVKGSSLLSVMHASLVTSSFIRESIENEFDNEGYRFG
uniref:Uncharacterized protein n=1 Tax=Solanum lycopersicum TaxID=4081 RepID=K4BES1_SOLLC